MMVEANEMNEAMMPEDKKTKQDASSVEHHAPPGASHSNDAHEPPSGDADGLQLTPASPVAIGAMIVALLVGASLGFLAGGVGGSGKPPAPTAESAKTESADSDPNKVTIDKSQSASIKVSTTEMQPFHGEKLTTGKIAFNDDNVTPIFSPCNGRIVKLMAHPGDVVQKGDALFEIDTPDLIQIESDLIGAVSSLKKSQTALNQAKRNEMIARRNIETGKRKLDLAKINEQRQKELFDDKAVALKDWEGAERDAKQAEQDLEQSNKDLEQALSDVKSAESDIYSNETVLNASRDKLRTFGKTDAEVEKIQSERLIDRIAKVYSPISGTVTQRKASLGEYITQNITDPMYMIAEMSTMWMLGDVYETDVSLVALGQSVEVNVMAYPKESFKGTISYISPACDPNTHRVAIRCVVDNPGKKLKSEMFANFRIITGDAITSPGLPPGAIVQEGLKKIVWVASSEENQFVKREVSTGVEQNGFIQILAGVKAGEKVAVDGGLFLSNKNSAD